GRGMPNLRKRWIGKILSRRKSPKRRRRCSAQPLEAAEAGQVFPGEGIAGDAIPAFLRSDLETRGTIAILIAHEKFPIWKRAVLTHEQALPDHLDGFRGRPVARAGTRGAPLVRAGLGP